MPASFRVISAPTAPPVHAASAAAAPAQIPDDYWQRLLKLIPAEVVAAYLALRGYTVPADYAWVWPLAGLILVLVLRIWGTRDPAANQKTQWAAVAIASASFVIWVYAIGDNFGWAVPQAWSGVRYGAVLLWTTLVPVFYKG